MHVYLLTAICNPQCVNGRCAFNETTGNNYCTCNAGWTGETCDTG